MVDLESAKDNVHELSNKLTAVMCVLSLVDVVKIPDIKFQEQLKYAAKAANQCGEITKDLIDILNGRATKKPECPPEPPINETPKKARRSTGLGIGPGH